jgi:hypothetical protein
MLYFAPPRFRKYGPPLRAATGAVLLAIGVAIGNVVLLIAGVLFITLAIVGWTVQCCSCARSKTEI